MARLLMFSVVTVAVSLVGAYAASNCVPVDQCQTLMDIWSSRFSIPGKSEKDIKAFIRSKSCGGRRVLCPDLEKEENVTDSDMEGMSGSGVFHVRPGGWNMWGQPTCQGVLKLHTIRAATLESLKPMAIRGNVKSLNASEDGRVVVRAVVDGPCCWQLNSLRDYKGQRQVLGLGHVGRPMPTPRSVGIVNCQGLDAA